MPRFYFTTVNGTSLSDSDGVPLRDEMEARLEAVRVTGQLLVHEPNLAFEGRDLRIDVSDQRHSAFSIVVTLQMQTLVSADNHK